MLILLRFIESYVGFREHKKKCDVAKVYYAGKKFFSQPQSLIRRRREEEEV
jgi:hypothetical protein